METVLKAIAILVAIGSGLVGVLGETRDKETDKIKALGLYAIGFICLSGVIALAITYQDYRESLMKRQHESAMEKSHQIDP